MKSKFVFAIIILLIYYCQPQNAVQNISNEKEFDKNSNLEGVILDTWSGTILENNAKYSSYNLIDGRTDSWCEGADVLPEKRFASVLARDKSIKVSRLYIINGFGNPEYREKNNRLKEISLKFYTGEENPPRMQYTLEDKYDNIIDFPEIEVTSIRIQILSVYPGTKYDDTCIAEVSFTPVKHSDLIGSKFKQDAQLRERDFWGREVSFPHRGGGSYSFYFDKNGRLSGKTYEGAFNYYLDRSHWKLENGRVLIELYASWREPQNPDARDINYRYNFSISGQTLINDVDGTLELGESSVRRTTLSGS